MKRYLFVIFAAFFMLMIPAGVYGASARLIINDVEVGGLPSPPIIVNDSVLVPARAVFEQMGSTVGWHAGNREVTVFHGSDILLMTIDNTTAWLNGVSMPMPVPPMIVNDSTMIPLRFPAEVFGFDVDWDDSRRAAIINSPSDYMPWWDGILWEGDEPVLNPPEDDPDYDPFWPGEMWEIHPHEETPPEEGALFDGITLPPPGVVVAAPEGTGLARDISLAPILTINHPETTITGLRTPRETGTAAYVVVASSPISSVTHFLLPDNRLVVDIHNARAMISGDMFVDPSVPVSGVRASQFSNEPRVARVVFDLVGSAEFNISLSVDRQLLTVSFSPNMITGITAQSDLTSDSLIIQGDVLPSIRISTEGFPNFLTLNIDNASLDAQTGMFPAGVFADNFVAGQRPDGTAFVQVYMKGDWPSFSLAHSANSVTLSLNRGITGVRYDSVNRELRISRENGFAIDIAQVQRIDEYLRYRYTMILPFSAHDLGEGELSVFDGFINSVTLERDAFGGTRLIFDTARVLAFTIYEMPGEYIIRAQIPRAVNPFIVVIDPGHGGSAPGTSHNGIVEKDLVLMVSHMVMQMINSNPSITGFMTRSEDVNVLNQRRAEFANEIGADLFISIHANAAVNRAREVNPAIHGVETWYTIGALEQQGSHSIDSREVARIMQRNMVQTIGAHDRGLMVGNNLVVLRESNMPSALLEIGFLTNPDEARRLATASHQQNVARAIYNGIVEIANRHPRR